MTSPHGQANTMWQTKVHRLLKAGYGIEDISVKLGCREADVRTEVTILREEGDLRRVLGVSDA